MHIILSLYSRNLTSMCLTTWSCENWRTKIGALNWLQGLENLCRCHFWRDIVTFIINLISPDLISSLRVGNETSYRLVIRDPGTTDTVYCHPVGTAPVPIREHSTRPCLHMLLFLQKSRMSRRGHSHYEHCGTCIYHGHCPPSNSRMRTISAMLWWYHFPITLMFSLL